MERRYRNPIARQLVATRSRRQVLGTAAKGTLGGAGAALIARGIGLGLLDDEPPSARAQGAVVRRSLHRLDAADATLADYAKAVGIMKGWNEDTTPDPADAERVKNWRRSWLYQAFIHGMPRDAENALIAELGGSPTDAEYAAALGERGWRTCEHHTDFFWPWHRMYLYWFERIVRKLSENPNWALPYWDYLDVEQRVLPEPFWKDPDSPLFVEARDPSLNSGRIPDLNAAEENAVFGNICAGLSQNQYGLASDRLETTPHDFVHGWAGGGSADPPMDPPGLMGAIRTSAQDPLFWLHHANLDRLWESWRTLGGTDPTDLAWQDHDVNSRVRSPVTLEPVTFLTIPYTFFDETGAKVSTVRVVKDVLDTTALGYTYDELFTPIVSTCAPSPIVTPPEAAGISTPSAISREPVELGRNQPDEPIAIGAEPVAIPVALEPPAEAASAAVRGENVVLTVEGVQGGGVPGTFFEIYLNLPEGQEPDFRSPYFVGNISLFGVQPWDEGEVHGDHMAARQFNISPNIAALEARGEWTGEVTVTVVPYYAGELASTALAGATPAAGATPVAALPPEGPLVTVEDVSVARQ